MTELRTGGAPPGGGATGAEPAHTGATGVEPAHTGAVARPDAVHAIPLIVAAVLAVVVPLTTITGFDQPLRMPLALAYLLMVPGVPLVALVRPPDRLVRICLGIGLSLAGQLLLTTGLLVTGLFSAGLMQALASLIALAAVAGCWLRAPGRRPVAAFTGGFTRFRDACVPSDVTGWLTAAGLVVALVLWVAGATTADPATMDGYGLLSLLNPALVTAMAVLALVAVLELRRSRPRPFWLGAVAVSFVLVLQGSASLIEPVAGIPAGWLHVGFAEYTTDHGAALLGYDARFSWPGFFGVLSATMTAAGVSDGDVLLRWAPLFNNLLMLLPVVLLARSLSPSRRAVWLVPILWSIGNWFQQDYLAPQAIAWFLALTVIAVLVWSTTPAPVTGAGWPRWSALPDGLRRPAVPAEKVDGLDSRGYLRVFAALLVLMGGVVVAHQLTPVLLVLALGVLSYARRSRLPGLWIVLAVMTALWLFYGATDFWAGHIGDIFGTVGTVGSNLNSGVAERVIGSPEHVQMQILRIGLCAVFLLLAVVGLVRIRRSASVLALTGLAFVPFALVALQSYGGEMMLRCFVFALPALSVAAAQTVVPLMRPRGSRPLLAAAGAWAMLFVLMLAQFAARGANAPFERITATQVEAVRTIEELAEPGDRVGAFNSFGPLGILEPGTYRVINSTQKLCGTSTPSASCVIESRPDFMYLSTSTEAYGHLVSGRPADWSRTLTAQVLASGHYEIVFQADDVTVLGHIDREGANG
jgi:hypothetical protein